MTEDDIRRIVRQTLDEERRLADERFDRLKRELNEEMDEQVLSRISVILTGFGMHENERREVMEDFSYLRRWRRGADKVTGIGITAMVTIAVGGILSALWLGIKALIGKS